MDKFILAGFNSQNIPFYDCSVAGKTREQWYSEGMISSFLGTTFLIYGFTAEIVYVLVMIVMWRLKNTNSCYKIMLMLGFFDMLAIGVNSIISGFLWFQGACYCTNPNLIYVAGSCGLSLWCGACIVCLILVTNRLCDLWNKNFAEILFGGWKMNAWLILPLLYTLYFFFFTPPILFNSSQTAWFFSPMILHTEEETAMFYNIPHTINNLSVVVITCLLYTLLCFIIGHKYGFDGMVNINKLQRSIMIQSILICMANLIASLVYVYMQFFTTPLWVILVGHMCWQAGHGIPAFVYLCLNQTIRRDVMILLHFPKRFRVDTISTPSPGSHSLHI